LTKIHHYTGIDTLAQILENRTIRFNRLDRVDDMKESEVYGKYKLGKFLFVSCWTNSNKESIPLWHMYSEGLRGVRITIDRDWMYYRPMKVDPKYKAITKGEVLSPIPFNRMLNDEYLILPDFMDRENVLRGVNYVDDPSVYYKNAVKIEVGDDGTAKMQMKDVRTFATYKHASWTFQEEVRFVLFILPSIPIPPDGFSNENYLKTLPSHIMQSIIEGSGPKLDCFDVDIDPEVLDNIIVTLGPLHNSGDEIVVKSLLEKYTKNGQIQKSSLTGTIKQPSK